MDGTPPTGYAGPLPALGGEIVWAARHEMARTLDDALSRRTRSLVLDARAAIEAAPEAARLMRAELGRDEAWARQQVDAFTSLARRYLIDEMALDEA